MKQRTVSVGDSEVAITGFAVLGDDERTIECHIVRMRIAKAAPSWPVLGKFSIALTAEEAISVGSALLAHGLQTQELNEELEHHAMTSTDHQPSTPAQHRPPTEGARLSEHAKLTIVPAPIPPDNSDAS